ncbi:polymerase [Bradyrhizobium sp. CCBAU 21359]|uniref:porin n=1 Tax=Bradyrhizobium sp. CCBAU 21359 TaxID=1325080 RepID=UPI002306C4D7|nr:porin [Bradyrhizobium sp. CCBAU 21359]MDA9457052.1 polymerase [Bradyrhizobium sp. CCBAU 21359]
MKPMMKSLILGSAAMLAGSGAQAADLPVKAKAVEYVKICSLYGAGFYYIPGTDTCIKLGGYLRAEVALGTNSDYNWTSSGVGGAHNRLSNYYTARSREDFNIDTRTATEYGVVRTFFDGVFSWTTGGYAGSGTGLTGGATAYDAAPSGTNGSGSIAGGSLGVYFAFIQFAGFTVGKAVSQFSAPWTNYPANNFDGLWGGGGTVTGVNQFTYTADFGQGVTAAISAQDQVQYYQAGLVNVSGITSSGIVGGAYGLNDIGGSRSPDLVGMVRVDQAWGLFQASVAAHDNHAGYYGGDETTGHPGDKWGWAVQLALSIKNIPTGAGDTINIQGVYTDGATRYNAQDLAPIAFSMFGGTGLAGAYQSVGFASAPDAVFVAGSGLQTIKTYGFNGGYTHNWDPNWNTGIYGMWAAVRYTDAAKGFICGSTAMGALLVTGSTCNPDFNVMSAGVITRWTPVKNLTFSADLNWSRLDQKYFGAVAYAGSAATAKPAAVYELKDQNSLTLLLRAQRNW